MPGPSTPRTASSRSSCKPSSADIRITSNRLQLHAMSQELAHAAPALGGSGANYFPSNERAVSQQGTDGPAKRAMASSDGAGGSLVQAAGSSCPSTAGWRCCEQHKLPLPLLTLPGVPDGSHSTCGSQGWQSQCIAWDGMAGVSKSTCHTCTDVCDAHTTSRLPQLQSFARAGDLKTAANHAVLQTKCSTNVMHSRAAAHRQKKNNASQ